MDKNIRSLWSKVLGIIQQLTAARKIIGGLCVRYFDQEWLRDAKEIVKSDPEGRWEVR